MLSYPKPRDLALVAAIAVDFAIGTALHPVRNYRLLNRHLRDRRVAKDLRRSFDQLGYPSMVAQPERQDAAIRRYCERVSRFGTVDYDLPVH